MPRSFWACLVIGNVFLVQTTFAQSQRADSVRCVTTCAADLNADGQSDLAILLQNQDKQQLVVLLATNGGYKSYLLRSDTETAWILICQVGNRVREAGAGPGKHKRRSFKTPGAYLIMSQPEGAAVAYFWNGEKFQEVWIAD